MGFWDIGLLLDVRNVKKIPEGIGKDDKKNYSGFDRHSWPLRTLPGYRNELHQINGATTQTVRDTLESKFGTRYSHLVAFDYFDPIIMSLIDPMQNLFQSTAKRLVKLWLKERDSR